VIAVYAIVCSVNDMKYVGSTTDVEKARQIRLGFLRSGKYKNRYLQRDWDRYGEAAFTFEILRPLLRLEEPQWGALSALDQQRLVDSEQYFINALNTLWPNGYNIDPVWRPGGFGRSYTAGAASHLTRYQFCSLNNIDLNTFNKMRTEGTGPELLQLGRFVFITRAANAEWQQRKAGAS
jgi:hypothetical protein